MKKIVNGEVLEMTEEEILAIEQEAEAFKKTAEYKANRIEKLKKALADTDYKILKIVEGEVTLSECAEIIKQRKSWREEINELEEERKK